MIPPSHPLMLYKKAITHCISVGRFLCASVLGVSWGFQDPAAKKKPPRRKA